jgi:hypothetical protein
MSKERNNIAAVQLGDRRVEYFGAPLEYHTECLPPGAGLAVRLNELGADGWEYAYTSTDGQQVFKRAKRTPGSSQHREYLGGRP